MTTERSGGSAVERWLPSWQNITRFLKGVVDLQERVRRLEDDNKKLAEQVETLQRRVDVQSGQLNVLIQFVVDRRLGDATDAKPKRRKKAD